MDELKRLVDRWKRTWLEKYFLGDDYGGEKRPNKPLHKDIISSYKSLYSYIDKLPPGSELLFKTLGEPGSDIDRWKCSIINYISYNEDLLTLVDEDLPEYSKNDLKFKKQLIDLVKLLCYKGSPVTLGTVDNCTPLYYMCHILNDEDLKILDDEGLNLLQRLSHDKPSSLASKVCKKLGIYHKLNKQNNWDTRGGYTHPNTYNGNMSVTPLHSMTLGRKQNEKRDDCVRFLSKTLEIDPNIKDRNDDTTLAWPVKFGNVEIVKTLLDRNKFSTYMNLYYGADPKVPNNGHMGGLTSFELCIDNEEITPSQQYDIVKSMLESQTSDDARQMVNKPLLETRFLNGVTPSWKICIMSEPDNSDVNFNTFRLLFQYGAERPADNLLEDYGMMNYDDDDDDDDDIEELSCGFKIYEHVKLLMAKKQLSFSYAFSKSEKHLVGYNRIEDLFERKINPLNVIDDRISMYSDKEKKEKKELKKAKYERLKDKAILDKEKLVWDLFIYNERRLKEVNDDLKSDPDNVELRSTQQFLDRQISRGSKKTKKKKKKKKKITINQKKSKSKSKPKPKPKY